MTLPLAEMCIRIANSFGVHPIRGDHCSRWLNTKTISLQLCMQFAFKLVELLSRSFSFQYGRNWHLAFKRQAKEWKTGKHHFEWINTSVKSPIESVHSFFNKQKLLRKLIYRQSVIWDRFNRFNVDKYFIQLTRADLEIVCIRDIFHRFFDWLFFRCSAEIDWFGRTIESVT